MASTSKLAVVAAFASLYPLLFLFFPSSVLASALAAHADHLAAAASRLDAQAHQLKMHLRTLDPLLALDPVSPGATVWPPFLKESSPSKIPSPREAPPPAGEIEEPDLLEVLPSKIPSLREALAQLDPAPHALFDLDGLGRASDALRKQSLSIVDRVGASGLLGGMSVSDWRNPVVPEICRGRRNLQSQQQAGGKPSRGADHDTTGRLGTSFQEWLPTLEAGIAEAIRLRQELRAKASRAETLARNGATRTSLRLLIRELEARQAQARDLQTQAQTQPRAHLHELTRRYALALDAARKALRAADELVDLVQELRAGLAQQETWLFSTARGLTHSGRALQIEMDKGRGSEMVRRDRGAASICMWETQAEAVLKGWRGMVDTVG